MNILGIIFLVVFVISAVLMVLLILIQDEQGDVMGGIFGGGSSTPFGSRSGNILTRTTTILGVIFLASSFLLAFNFRSPDVGNVGDAVKSEQKEDWWNKKTSDAPAAVPAVPADAKALEASGKPGEVPAAVPATGTPAPANVTPGAATTPAPAPANP